jgi:hypothetical protein
MERQLLYLLDWDLNFDLTELEGHFEPFLAPIRNAIQEERRIKIHHREAERRSLTMVNLDTSLGMRTRPRSLNVVRHLHQTSRISRAAALPYNRTSTSASLCQSASSPAPSIRRSFNKEEQERM